ncbi:MAG: pantetheine-phosphate adenylyltransferase [Rickettsiales bacterium]
MSNKIGVYPGTFDPITYGHQDIIEKALDVVDELIVAVACDVTKNPIFTIEERLDLVNQSLKSVNQNGKKIRALSFTGLLVDFARGQNADLIIRGLRAVSDFEYEFQLSAMNAKLDNNVQTIFLPATEKTQFIASRMVKEVAKLKGDVSGFVSPHVEKKLRAHYNT